MAKFPGDPLSVTPAWLQRRGADVRECRLEQIGIGVGLLGRRTRAHLEGGPDVPKSAVVEFPMLDPSVVNRTREDLEFDLSEVRLTRTSLCPNPLRPAHRYFAAFDAIDTPLRPRARGSASAPHLAIPSDLPSGTPKP